MLIMAIFVFGSCNNKDSEMLYGHITLQALHNTSRASFDGQKTTWEDGDQIKTVFADANTEQQLIFATSNPSQGVFTSTTAAQLGSGSYNILATYPAQTTTIDASTNSAEVSVGAASQTQTGSSSAHIATLDAMYGSTTATADNISLRMNHTASVLKFEIQNSTQAAITAIESVKIIAPQGVSLSGSRSINFSTNAISGNDGGNKIVVNIDGNSATAADSYFTVWAAAAPFSIDTDESLKFIVKADGKSYEFIKDFNGEGCDFPAGKIMHTTLTLSDASLMASEKSITAVFSDETQYPAGFPDKNATSPISGSYKFGDYYYNFGGNVNMYYYNGGLKIYLDENNKYGTISLPMIDEYVLEEVVVKLRDTYSRRSFKIAITDGNLNPVDGGTKNNLKQSMTYNLFGLNSSTQYYLYAYVENITQEQPCDITSIKMSYTLQ